MIINKSAKIVLINGTEYDWKKSFCFAYQMVSFKFPEIIKGSTAEICDLQWSDRALITEYENHADVRYELIGTSYSFNLQARIQTGFDIFVYYNNLSNLGNNFIRLEWLDDDSGFIQFYLSGRDTKFLSTASFQSTSSWMFDNLSILGDHLLTDLCIPGSHDSGMSGIFNGKSTFATLSNTQTQNLNIYQQLMCGIRYFDIRPVLSNGLFYSGHYALVGYNYQGAKGQSIKEIIEQINSFVACNNELIILSISHGLNLDLGNIYSNRKLNQQEYSNFFLELLNINYRFIINSKEKVNLTEKNLNYFIGNKRSAVCIILNDLDDLDIEIDSAFYHQGFFCKNEFPIYDKYSNTNDLKFMIKDQLNKMVFNKNEKSRKYFLLSWTLTQQIWPKLQIAFGNSILNMATTANSNLFKLIAIPKLNKYSFKEFVKQKSIPNVIYLDFVTPDLTCMCLAICLFNHKFIYDSNRNTKLIAKSKDFIILHFKNLTRFIDNHLMLIITVALNLIMYFYLY